MSDTIRALTEAVRGRVTTASDPDDGGRAVHNAVHDRNPHAVVQCTDGAEVMDVIYIGEAPEQVEGMPFPALHSAGPSAVTAVHDPGLNQNINPSNGR